MLVATAGVPLGVTLSLLKTLMIDLQIYFILITYQYSSGLQECHEA
jgi:hypothetical protein